MTKGDSMVIITILVISTMLYQSEGQPQVPCFFIFGDSLSDSGNNNNLPVSLAKANFLPYGIDFPGGPTGRFTNGRTTVDLIGDLLGLENYIPPFPSASDANMIKGVNYASGSGGIRVETGFQVGMRISMDEQLQRHQTVVQKIQNTLGLNATDHLNKCLYSVYVGSNDWMINYFSRPSMTLRYMIPDAYADALIDQLSQQLTTLYNTGARKIILFGMSPLGCLPTANILGQCSGIINGALSKYNDKLKTLADKLNKQLMGSNFIWINSMGIIGPNLENLGMKVKKTPCCGALNFACLPSSIPCPNRDEHVYWDNAHTTEAANKVLANRAFIAKDPTDTYPMDISHLAKL